ncbi:MAG: glycosyltransferase family 4 protein [Kiritimatiellia bacterium]|jgi:glycosyltransferase involved in cell wall biosynthesis
MRLAFVCPRLHESGTVGGAETLLYSLAVEASRLGHEVEYLVTCAKNHFTWANELPEGAFERDGLCVRRFPVNADRDVETFHRLQEGICRGQALDPGQEEAWLRNSVNADGLVAHLLENAAVFDRVVAGPYLFGLVEAVSRALPEKTLLVPCLHDEPFARVGRIRDMFQRVRGFLFNTEPERRLAHRLFDLQPQTDAIVAMGIEPFAVDPGAFAKRTGITGDYVIYCGRREPLKGTPLLVDYLDCFRQRTGRDVKLVMTGSGEVPIPPTLAAHVHDLGFVSEQEKREAMAGAVAFCHPSVNESLGIVILEAWLAGAPALVHARGEVLRWQCESSNGGLWFANYPEFEAMLLFYLDHRDQAAAIGAQGRAYTLGTYSPEAVRERLQRALEA